MTGPRGLGETRPVTVDVRIVSATNANLDAMVTEGRFREDLFYRLNPIPLQVPPLGERREEIAREMQKTDLRVADETREYLVLYRWPGNVRQLASEMRRMVALAEPGAALMPEHLSTPIAASRRTLPASERRLDATEMVVRTDQPLAALDPQAACHKPPRRHGARQEQRRRRRCASSACRARGCI